MVRRRGKEESINDKFAYFICARLAELGYSHNLVNVEWDKHGMNFKYGEVDGELIGPLRPDIILHRLGDDYYNILVIEAKKEYPNKKDKRTVHALLHEARNPDNNYLYNYGCFICYTKKRYCIVSKNDFVWTDNLKGRYKSLL